LLLALLLYPGLASAIALALLLAWLTERRLAFGRVPGPRVLGSFDGAAAVASILLSALALALMPWPYHPAAGWSPIGNPIALWCAIEGAFLVAQLPSLLGPSALSARAANRELQVSLAGRCVVWLAIGGVLWGGVGWSLAALPGRLLLGLAGLLAVPAAIGSGPFGAERSLSAAGAEEGLDEGAASLVRLARLVRGAALLAALVVASAPQTAGAVLAPALFAGARVPVQPWIVLLLIVALFLVIVLLLRQVSSVMPRMTLPAALQWCWQRALPIALVGLGFLFLVRS
jgi:hypothetical protein